MTGYGKGEKQVQDRRFVVEIKSVNGKYVEFHIRMPRFFNSLEDRLRKQLSARIFRGRVDVNVNFVSTSVRDAKISYNKALAESYTDALTEIARDFDLYLPDHREVFSLIARFPDVVEIDRELDGDTLEDLWCDLSAAAADALDNFLTMREVEGAALAENIRSKGIRIGQLQTVIEAAAPAVVENYRTKLKKRMEEALKEIAVDEYRFLNEVAHFADKSAIDEEITRLKSHLAQLPRILDGGGAVGKKLDFLAQEMAREANTIGAKANFADITKHVIELKGEIEKIREQVQNIE